MLDTSLGGSNIGEHGDGEGDGDGSISGRGAKRKQLSDTYLISISAKLFASAKQ